MEAHVNKVRRDSNFEWEPALGVPRLGERGVFGMALSPHPLPGGALPKDAPAGLLHGENHQYTG